MQKITIKDVAKEAGVAPSTVSRVLNGSPRISEATRDMVMEVVKKLNYHPNTIARNLANRSTKTIGIVIPSDTDDLFKNPFWLQVIRGFISGPNAFNMSKDRLAGYKNALQNKGIIYEGI